jgi:hypothetical protein
MKLNILYVLIVFAVCLLWLSCKKENTNTDSSSTSAIAIGKNYEGGIIFYVDATGQHGLIAASTDQSRLISWYNGTHTVTNVKDVSVGAGQANTTAIIGKQGVGNYAAILCDELVLNGYSDWFLPSKEELNLLYQQRDKIGGFATNYYWTSVEYDTTRAWNQYFPFGPQFYADKADSACVRAVRAF